MAGESAAYALSESIMQRMQDNNNAEKFVFLFMNNVLLKYICENSLHNFGKE